MEAYDFGWLEQMWSNTQTWLQHLPSSYSDGTLNVHRGKLKMLHTILTKKRVRKFSMKQSLQIQMSRKNLRAKERQKLLLFPPLFQNHASWWVGDEGFPNKMKMFSSMAVEQQVCVWSIMAHVCTVSHQTVNNNIQLLAGHPLSEAEEAMG